MARVKKGKRAHKKRKNVLQHVKGFRWGRKNKFKQAKEALAHAWTYAFRDRKTKKRNFRRLWQIKINAASRSEGVPYSDLIYHLKEKGVVLDRKVLADLAENHPLIFREVVNVAKKNLS
ncbi:MAG: 50S ribosomal protein L20 [Candidatus Pacebacteria bacterium]|nr:50S ribosomal protein L20 [Candidatus Paceibacterota bacterium]